MPKARRAIESSLQRLRANGAVRGALRAALAGFVAERRLARSSLRVRFPAGKHLGMFFCREVDYEPGLTGRLAEWLPLGGVAVDVGANLGIYTLLFHQQVGAGGVIFAFEPDPQNLRWLESNIADNGLRNVRVRPVALGERAGESTLYQDVATTRTSSLVPDAWQPDAVPRRAVVVRVETLDALLDEVRRLDFVKIDTEGFECAVLRGGLRLFERFGPRILVEVLVEHCAEVRALLEPLGYRFCDPETARDLGDGPWPSNVLCVPSERGVALAE